MQGMEIRNIREEDFEAVIASTYRCEQYPGNAVL